MCPWYQHKYQQNNSVDWFGSRYKLARGLTYERPALPEICDHPFFWRTDGEGMKPVDTIARVRRAFHVQG